MGLQRLRVLRRTVDEAAASAPKMATEAQAGKPADAMHAALMEAGIEGTEAYVEWGMLYVQCPIGGWEVTARSPTSVVVQHAHGRSTFEREGADGLLGMVRRRAEGVALLERVLTVLLKR